MKNQENLTSDAKKALTDSNLKVRYIHLDDQREVEIISLSFPDYVPRIKESVYLKGQHYIVDNVYYNIDENFISVILIPLKDYLKKSKRKF